MSTNHHSYRITAMPLNIVLVQIFIWVIHQELGWLRLPFSKCPSLPRSWSFQQIYLGYMSFPVTESCIFRIFLAFLAYFSIEQDCHGLCFVTFFPKNNQRTAPTEPPMMADSPLFSATITTGHPCQTYIGAPLEYFLHSVRATAEQLSRDIAGDPKHIYKHKIRQESAPSRGS